MSKCVHVFDFLMFVICCHICLYHIKFYSDSSVLNTSGPESTDEPARFDMLSRTALEPTVMVEGI